MLLRQKIRTPIWPYVVVVTCLFLLSILASRTWRSRHWTEKAHDWQPSQAESASSAAMDSSAGIRTSAAVESVTPPIRDARTRTSQVMDPSEFGSVFGIETPRQEATIAPRVAEQITFDVSVKDTPALPADDVAPSKTPLDQSSTEHVSDAPADAPPMVERSSLQPLPEVASVFPHSPVLVQDYEALWDEPLARAWAQHAVQILEQLHQSPSLVSPEATKLLDQLFSHSQQANQLAAQAESLPLRASILRLGYATQRRSEVWRQIQKIVAGGDEHFISEQSANIATHISAVEQRLQSASQADDWRKYLLLDDVKLLLQDGDVDSRRNLAKRVLKRIDSPQLTESQAEVFRNPPFESFSQELRRWASEPVDYLRLLDDIEVYERSRTTGDALPVAQAYEALRWSAHPDVEKLAELLNTHYRNSNVRVALTGEFLNRLLPDPQQFNENIAENISGANVYGTSRTLNKLRVVLVPDGNNLRLGLEAHGEVNSDTSASKGPATFYNQGFARYYARKLLLIDRRGIRVWRAEAVADSESELTGFETDFDALPLIGWLARSMARQQHDERYYESKAETEATLEYRATTRFDDEVHARLATAENEVNQKLIQPFEKLDLKPTPLDLRTTEQRIIARYRLADTVQLGAHSPRPQAPGDSLMSVQVHESALNNTLANLKLEGKRTDLQSLYRELADTFERTDLPVPDDIPQNVVVQFADREAVRVQCDDGRVTLTIQIAELRSGRNFRRTNFGVRAYYVPDASQLNANLVRDGIIEVMGERPGYNLVVLRGIFNKVLSKSRTFNIVNQKLAKNPRLHDVHVNQFVINDGWIGVAMGPSSAGELEHLAKERETDRR